MKRIVLTYMLAGCALMTGCSWLQVGEEEFACSGMPGSVFCHSARDVYQRTNNGEVPSPIRGDSYNPKCTDCVRAEDAEATKIEGEVVAEDAQRIRETERTNTYVAPNLPDRPVPIRTPAQVMRIWVGPYVDTSGDLVSPGLVYTEIEPRRWLYPDQKNALNNRIMKPLEAQAKESLGSSILSAVGVRRGEEPPFSALENYATNVKARMSRK